MAIVIKKRIFLDFLGEEYSDSYIVVKAISIGDYENLGDATVRDTVIDRFIEGEIQQDKETVKITKENLTELPGQVFTEAFDAMIGKLDPKSEGQSTNPSSTSTPPPQN